MPLNWLLDKRSTRIASNESTSEAPASAGASDLELGPLVSKYYQVFLLVGALVALVVWTATFGQPNQYTSVVDLRIDGPTARDANALMRSNAVLDVVMAKLDVPGSTIEQRRRWLDSKRSLAVAPGGDTAGTRLFRQEVIDEDPARAKAINTAFVDAWLEAIKPAPIRKSFIESEITRLEEHLALIDKYLEQADKEAGGSTAASTPQAEGGTIINVPDMRIAAAAALLTKREETTHALARLREELHGTNRDGVFSVASLPEEPIHQRYLLNTVLATISAEMMLLFLILVTEIGRVRWRR